MAVIFPKGFDRRFRLGVLVVVSAGAVATALLAYWSRPEALDTGYAPLQPVEYSHKTHAGNLGMDCRYCHFTVEKAAFAAIPPTSVCMNCHTQVLATSPLLAPVRESYDTGAAIPWVKVHVLPDFVYFNHSAHVNAGVACVTCHGRVDQMQVVRKVQPMNMAWCLDCHRNPAPYLRPVDQVTNMSWQPDRPAEEIGREIMQARQIRPPVDCAGCHR